MCASGKGHVIYIGLAPSRGDFLWSYSRSRSAAPCAEIVVPTWRPIFFNSESSTAIPMKGSMPLAASGNRPNALPFLITRAMRAYNDATVYNIDVAFPNAGVILRIMSNGDAPNPHGSGRKAAARGLRPKGWRGDQSHA